MTTSKVFTNATGAPVADNTNIMTAGPRGPALLQDIWLLEKLAHFDREVIPERRIHAKGWGAHGTFTVTHDITRFTKAKIFSAIGKQTPMFARISTVAGERLHHRKAGDTAEHVAGSRPARVTLGAQDLFEEVGEGRLFRRRALSNPGVEIRNGTEPQLPGQLGQALVLQIAHRTPPKAS